MTLYMKEKDSLMRDRLLVTDEAGKTLYRIEGKLLSSKLTIEDADVALDGEDTVITFSLTQEQSATFREGRARVEVNWVDADGFRNATTIEELAVTPNLLNRVIEHDG